MTTGYQINYDEVSIRTIQPAHKTSPSVVQPGLFNVSMFNKKYYYNKILKIYFAISKK